MTLAYNLSQLANYVNSSGQLDAATGLTNTASVGFPTGTYMLFQQTAAPTGWTKQTTHNNKALRVVSGTASSGGTVAFTTAFASGLNAGATTLSTTQIPSHQHTAVNVGSQKVNSSASLTFAPGTYTGMGDNTTDYGGLAGGGGSHNHTLPSFDVSYVDIIIAVKN